MSFGSPADRSRARLEDADRRVDAVIQRDPGERGLAHWANPGDLRAAAHSLLDGTRIAITTGFYISENHVIETDGPPGAIVLAQALTRLGKCVDLLVDEHAAGIIDAGLACVSETAPGITVELLPPGVTPELRAMREKRYSHIVAVERPGRSEDGTYRTMRGEDITPFVAAVDELFIAPRGTAAKEATRPSDARSRGRACTTEDTPEHPPGRGYTTIAIGDGGNELGLGGVADAVDRYHAARAHGTAGTRPGDAGSAGTADSPSITARTSADYCIYAGVSNWGAYGLCAMLTMMTGTALLPPPELVPEIVRALVRSGAVDGVHRQPVPTVDGLPLSEETGILEELREITNTFPVAGDLGEAAFLWSWPGGIARETSARVLSAYRLLRDDPELRHAGMVDVVPAYASLAVHLDPLSADRDAVHRRVEMILSSIDQDDDFHRSAPSVWRLPVVYDGEDLSRVAHQAGLTPRQVVEIHCGGEYTVAMIGFRPHFPYLLGMDERIATPRLETPRTRIAAGSVGIAGAQTGVYPQDSPGGWNIIGSTDPQLLREIRPGDTVYFTEKAV